MAQVPNDEVQVSIHDSDAHASQAVDFAEQAMHLLLETAARVRADLEASSGSASDDCQAHRHSTSKRDDVLHRDELTEAVAINIVFDQGMSLPSVRVVYMATVTAAFVAFRRLAQRDTHQFGNQPFSAAGVSWSAGSVGSLHWCSWVCGPVARRFALDRGSHVEQLVAGKLLSPSGGRGSTATTLKKQGHARAARPAAGCERHLAGVHTSKIGCSVARNEGHGVPAPEPRQTVGRGVLARGKLNLCLPIDRSLRHTETEATD